MIAYLCIALLFLAILVGSILDAKRVWFATFFAVLVALAWPIVAVMVLRGWVAKWRAERVAREAYRKARERLRA